MIKYFNNQQKIVIGNIDTFGKGFKDASIYLFPLKSENEILQKLLLPIINSTVEDGAEKFIDDFGLNITFDMASPYVSEFFDQREMLITKINKTTFKKLENSLNEGISAGETPFQLKERVKKVYTHAKTYRNKLIARTETNTANNFAHMQSMRQAEVEKKEWITAGDTKVRQTHIDNGEEGCIILEVEFSGTEELYPGEPNCRCVVIVCITEAKKIPVVMLKAA